MGPPHDRQDGRRAHDDGQAPVVDRAGHDMAAGAFRAEHRDDVTHHAAQADKDVHTDDRQKDIGRGRNRDAQNNDTLISHRHNRPLDEIETIEVPSRRRRHPYSSNASKNSCALSGPDTSSRMGPASGSTVNANRRKRQH